MSKRVLLFANDIGGGLGHVRRAIHIANLLRERGWQTAMLFHNSATAARIPTGLESIHIPLTKEQLYVKFRALFSPVHYFPAESLPGEPYFWEFASLNYQVLRDGYFTPSLVNARFNRISKAVNQWKPDLLVGDGHLLTGLVGKRLGLPVVQVIRSFVFPEKPDFLWWKQTPQDLIPPASLQAFEKPFGKLNMELPADASGLLNGDAYLVPGTDAIEPIRTSTPHLFYGYRVNSDYDPRLQNLQLKRHTKKVYITVGGGSWKSGLSDIYQFLLSILQKFDVQIIVSDPFNVLDGDDRWHGQPNIEIFRWIESSTVFPNLDLIIHHGGYSTMMESLWWGVPSIILPFHSEQEGNGRRLEQLGVGKLFSVAAVPYRTVGFRSYSGEFTMRGGFEFGLKKEEIIPALEHVLSNDETKTTAANLSDALRKKFNPEEMTDFLENV